MAPKVKINLLEKANHLPTTPGCYLMKNDRQEIIYVGKAKNLRARVSSYFKGVDLSVKTQFLVSHINDFDFLLADNDAESFIIENNLIKKHRPKYNIRLKDNKSYPYIVIDWKEDFPRFEFKRKLKKTPKLEILGPFVVGSNVGEMIRVLNRQFSLRDCSLSDFLKRKETCLLFQMDQCTAPCVGKIDRESYAKNFKTARDVFVKNGAKAIRVLEDKMTAFAEEMAFEKASFVRDDLIKIKEFVGLYHQVNAEWHDERDIDIVGFFIGELEIDLSIYMVRGGLLLGHKNIHFASTELSDPLDEIMTALLQFYDDNDSLVPQYLITTFSEESNDLLAKALKTKVIGPIKKQYATILDLTKEHAFEAQRVRLFQLESPIMGLKKLQELLNLKERPVRLECFDIAIFAGEAPTGSQIVSIDGQLSKEDYRYYHLQELPEKNNDFAMMKELLDRRLNHENWPDVFIVDGGIGQVNVVLRLLADRKLAIPVIGITKKEELLVIPGRLNPFPLLKNRSLAKIIISMRDEAHRFSRKLHHHQFHKNRFV